MPRGAIKPDVCNLRVIVFVGLLQAGVVVAVIITRSTILVNVT